jgi:hypothetical protein
VHWFYKQYKEEIPSLETPGTNQPGAKGVDAGPELEAPEYYSRRPPGGYSAYPGYDMYKHYEPKQYEPKGYERPGPVSGGPCREGEGEGGTGTKQAWICPSQEPEVVGRRGGVYVFCGITAERVATAHTLAIAVTSTTS